MRRLILLLATLSVATALRAGAPAVDLPDIALEPRDGGWRVSYRLQQPVTEMRFARADAQGNRARLWQPVDGEFEIALVENVEVLRRVDGAAFTHAAFDMAPRYVPLEKDYAPFSPFGDGGLLIHTGRFFACAPSCDDEGQEWKLAIEAPAGSHIIHEGRLSRRRLSYVDRASGTNLYVGSATPIATRHVIAVIDEAFPPKAREQLAELFPRLMDFYAERLGALPAKPMLYASHDERHPGGGFGHQGGVLPGQVFMHLYGPRSEEDPAAFADGLSAFFAHEAGHLFQHYEDAEPHSAWIHEGGADAFSLLALDELGLLAAGTRQLRTRQAIEACAEGIGDIALDDSMTQGKFANYYSCGMLIHLAVDAAARRSSDGACDLFCVWRMARSRK